MLPTGDVRPSHPQALTADGPGTGTGLRIKQRCPVVLLVLGSGSGVTRAAYCGPSFKGELIFASVAAVTRNDGRIAAGLARGDRFERRHRYATGKSREGFLSLALQAGAAGGLDALRCSAHLDVDPRAAEEQRRLGGRSSVCQADAGLGAGRVWRGKRGSRDGQGDQGEDGYGVCAFCKQARNRGEVPAATG